MASTQTAPALNPGNGSHSTTNGTEDPTLEPPLIVDIANSTEKVEIFPEEIVEISPDQLTTLLRNEAAPLTKWTEAALLYMTHKCERESTTLLTTACTELLEGQNLGDRQERVQTLAAAGIAYLTQAKQRVNNAHSMVEGTPGSIGGDSAMREELRGMADTHFLKASKLDQMFPMTWIGKGMYNLSIDRVDQARFFFQTTLKTCGKALPALLGMACVHFKEQNYKASLDMYISAITLFPDKSGASARVGMGLACYRLGQVDRAKACFQRAHELDSENVEAMVGLAVLDMAHLDERLSKDYRKRMEKAIKLISTANLMDHSNAMVQNHLANHYFWKWTHIPGVTLSMKQGSTIVKGSGPITLEAGDIIRIGANFETSVLDEDEDEDDDNMDVDDDDSTFKIKNTWRSESIDGLPVWKKDYDRVISLAKGAISSTSVSEIQAESFFLLARVYHTTSDMVNAHKYYEKAVKLAPNLYPARYGLAQTLIWEDTLDDATAHLRLVLGQSSSATDANAALGLLEVKSGEDRKMAFSYLKKAIDLDPLNPDLVLLEGLALQQQESDYSTALDRYEKAVDLMRKQGQSVSWEIWTNMGVLCHETKKYEGAAEAYQEAFKALDSIDEVILESSLEKEDHIIRQEDNSLFWDYVDTHCEICSKEGESANWNIIGEKLNELVHIGDHVRVGDSFESEVLSISVDHLELKNKFHISENNTVDEVEKEAKQYKLYIKKSNNRLDSASAISISFNLARLHEATGRTVSAVELHKAIVKRHPSYVNSYLRLACIARDCGSLKNCSEWLKCAHSVAPGNPEVLTLVGNLHLSLCDWQQAQNIFDQLLSTKVSNVDAYSKLCLGNVYFNNLNTPNRYAKHLQHAANYYESILKRDKANAYAANGIGTILAEKADLPRAKEIFNRVREISGDTIPDALLNLGHIYLALSKHAEALKMYENYMDRTRNNGAPISSKSQDDDDATVLHFIAFSYFDWARQTEAFNNSKAAPADERYKLCIEYIEKAIKKTEKENLVLRYNLCMAKLQAANCVLVKLTRNIRRTAQEVQDALDGMEDSLPKVQQMLRWKEEGKKIPVSTSLMKDFIVQCKGNIDSAKSHLRQELQKEEDANEVREIQRLEAETSRRTRQLVELELKERQAKEFEQKEQRARAKMNKVSSLVETWENETKLKVDSDEKKPVSDGPKPEAVDTHPVADDNLFDDDSEDEDNNQEEPKKTSEEEPKKTVEVTDDGEPKIPEETEQDLFGDSESEQDENENESEKQAIDNTPDVTEPAPAVEENNEEEASSNKRSLDNDDEEVQDTKKRRVVEEEGESD